jgi:Na+-driven multidrug efflux pump
VLTAVDRRIIRLGVPALGTLAAEPLYRIVDTAIVGRLGTDQLAGLAIAVTVLALVVAGSNFLTYGTTERVAKRLGAGRRGRRAGDVAGGLRGDRGRSGAGVRCAPDGHCPRRRR